MKNVGFEGFCCGFGKEREGGEGAGNQGSNIYPSFIVRLSFVIGSFKVGNR